MPVSGDGGDIQDLVFQERSGPTTLTGPDPESHVQRGPAVEKPSPGVYELKQAAEASWQLTPLAPRLEWGTFHRCRGCANLIDEEGISR